MANQYGIVSALCLCGFLSHATGKSDVSYSPTRIYALQEFGMVQKGNVDHGQKPFSDLWIDHFGAFITQDGKIGERTEFSAGIGGIFQFPLPDRGQPKWPGIRNKWFFIGPSEATFGYKFGDVEWPWLKITGGMFPYKYNPQASNLGEYLMRSEAYPNVVFTGGYSVINNSTAYLQGLNFQFRFGNLELDILTVTEMALPPLYDVSLAAIANYTIMDGFLELGAGVNFKRILTLQNEASRTREVENNAYFKYRNTWYTGYASNYGNPATYYFNLYNETLGGDTVTAADSILADQYLAKVDSLDAILDVIGNVIDSRDSLLLTDSLIGVTEGPQRDSLITAKGQRDTVPEFQFYQSSAIIPMVRFTLDPKVLFSTDIFGPEDLKIFGEAALLGVKDYPVFYDNPRNRLPMMAGINLPGFKLLDLISLQVEYHDNPYVNSYSNRGQQVNLNLPFVPSGEVDGQYFNNNAYNGLARQDNWAWSLLLQKQILPGLTFSSQFAKDHFRVVSDVFFFGPNLEPLEVTPQKDNWYWMVQIGMGI